MIIIVNLFPNMQ